MKGQIKYIINGSLILLMVFLVAFIGNKILVSEKSAGRETIMIDQFIPVPVAVESDGRRLFISKCASCHHLIKDGTGPALVGLLERGQWSKREKIYEWVRNPAAFMINDPYTKALQRRYGSLMTSFPELKDEEIDAIIEYINGI